jgi:hypothetical protein
MSFSRSSSSDETFPTGTTGLLLDLPTAQRPGEATDA